MGWAKSTRLLVVSMLVARGESDTEVDSMRELIHSLHCDLLRLQGTQSDTCIQSTSVFLLSFVDI